MSNSIKVHPFAATVQIGFLRLNSCNCSVRSRRYERGEGLCLAGKSRADSTEGNFDSSGDELKTGVKTEPPWLRAAVSGVTELLRMIGTDRERGPAVSVAAESSTFAIEDIVAGIRQDYARTYFLTGEFLESIYTEDCIFADPTIQFSGRDLYKRNLKLLVPFFEDPLLTLDSIKQGEDSGSRFIETSWKLSRVYLKLPWKPFISVDGRTKYNLNGENQIMEHTESWNVTGLEAVGQIFKPSKRAFRKDSNN